ncbi:MAG: F0F1 ATP synthase subunit delta [Betaproteobacteria bacterium]|jgi:ATP synthase, F1 delta subunit|nr:F0F1 ATP synthase subunit delta [Betaproteobacteria bacterium]
MAEMMTIARPYAEAVFSRALETQQISQWGDRLALLAQVSGDQCVVSMLSNPRLTKQEKAVLLTNLCAEGLGEEGRNFLSVMADNNRLGILAVVAQQFEVLRHEHEGVLDAGVVSASPMDQNQIAELSQQLTKRFGKPVRIQHTVNPELLGGFCVTVGDTMIDGSVRARLQQLSVALKQ